MNDAQLLERLGTAYASVAAPAPSADLLELMAQGGRVADPDDDRTSDAVVVPFVVRRPPTRLRYSVAAAIAVLGVFGGLAVAGALPDSVQRQVSSFAKHFGLDLPAPSGPGHTSSAPGNEHATPATAPLTLPVTTEPVVPPAAADPPASAGSPTTPVPTTAGALTGTLGGIGAVGSSVSTTIPSTGGSPLPEPTVTVPPPTVPPATLPATTLPPVTLPQLLPLPLPGL